MSEPESCPRCGGPLYELGNLGRILWYRCRDCGADVARGPDDDVNGRVKYCP